MPWNAQWKRIRDLPFIKIWMISACWVWVTAILPVVYINEYYLFKPDLWLHATEIGCLLMAITLPFDLRDEIADKAVGVKTFVTEFGMQKSIFISLFFLLISALITMYLFLFMGVSGEVSWSMWITQFVAMLLIMQSSYSRPDYYYSILMDGVLILPWGCYMFLSYP
jgi:4-hydroxybenzoate polyprenyltransferase